MAAWDHDEAIVNLSFQSTTEIVKDLFANNNQALIEAFQVTNFIDQLLIWDFFGTRDQNLCFLFSLIPSNFALRDLFANINQALFEAFQVTNFIDQVLFLVFFGELRIGICVSYFPSFPQIFLSEKLTEKCQVVLQNPIL